MNLPIGPTSAKWKVQPTKWRKKKGEPGGKTPYQGFFFPGAPAKYQGDLKNVVFRSGMELRMMKHLDESPSVLTWSSEETIIPYVSPLDNKVHRYFMDFKATIKRKDGTERTCLIEVKPSLQCVPPQMPKNPKRAKVAQARYLREAKTYAVNQAKWSTTKQVCAKQGWDFVILTEKSLRF